MRTDVVSNFPPPWWIGTLVMLTKLDCQRAFTLILLVCRPLDQAYRHGNEVGRERERKRERWSRLCWHGLASVQHNTHTLTLINTISNTLTWPGNRPRFVQMGYYSDVQLYSKGSSTLTTLSGQLKATTSLCLENNQDSVTTDATKWKVFLDTLSVSEGFSLFVIHGSKKLHPTWKGPLTLVSIQRWTHTFKTKLNKPWAYPEEMGSNYKRTCG